MHTFEFAFFFLLCIYSNLILVQTVGSSQYITNFNQIETKTSQQKVANVTSLVIAFDDISNAEFKFGAKTSTCSVLSNGKTQDFSINYLSKPLLSIDKHSNMMLFPIKTISNSLTFTNDFKIRGVPQWKLLFEEDLTKPAGWTDNSVTECAGIKMLGGYCKFSKGEVYKIFDKLPTHTSIRIQATFHFIDAWDGESAFMRVDNGINSEMQYVWVERYSAFKGGSGIDICGGHWPEGKFASPIDVSIPHTLNSIKVGFGSTNEQDPCDQSFGVSGIRIFIK